MKHFLFKKYLYIFPFVIKKPETIEAHLQPRGQIVSGGCCAGVGWGGRGWEGVRWVWLGKTVTGRKGIKILNLNSKPRPQNPSYHPLLTPHPTLPPPAPSTLTRPPHIEVHQTSDPAGHGLQFFPQKRDFLLEKNVVAANNDSFFCCRSRRRRKSSQQRRPPTLLKCWEL